MIKLFIKLLLTLIRKLRDAYKKERKERKEFRRERKLEVSKATAIARNAAKVLKQQEKREHKHHTKLTKLQLAQKSDAAKILSKDQEKKRKHELDLAKEKVNLIKAGKLLNPTRISRYLAVTKLVSPILIPLIYRLALLAKNAIAHQQNAKLGNASLTQPHYSKVGSQLNHRINQAVASLEQISQHKPGNLEIKQFIAATKNNLSNLATATANAETFPKERKKQAQASIDQQLITIEKTIFTELGVGK